MLYDRKITKEETSLLQEAFKRIFDNLDLGELNNYLLKKYFLMKMVMSISESYTYMCENKQLLEALYNNKVWYDLDKMLKRSIPFRNDWTSALYFTYNGTKFKLLKWKNEPLELTVIDKNLYYNDSIIDTKFIKDFINSERGLTKEDLYEFKNIFLEKLNEKINLSRIKGAEKEEEEKIKKEAFDKTKESINDFIKEL